MEINWVVTLLLGAMLSIPINVVTNLMTPNVRDWLEQRALSTRGKRLENLNADYQRVKRLHDHPEFFRLTVIRQVINGFSGLLTFVVFGVAPHLIVIKYTIEQQAFS